MLPGLESASLQVEQDLSFGCLVGGGVMGAATRAFDWSETTLGPISYWPSALRMAVSLCLNAQFPSFL